MRSSLPFRRQERSYSCAVACLRMLLEYYRLEISEKELRHQCHTTELGTFARDVVSCAQELGFEAQQGCMTQEGLKELVAEQIYPIVYVNMYPLTGIFTTHALILEGFGPESVEAIDPLEGRRSFPRTAFMESWATCGNLAIIIRPKLQGGISE